MEASWRALSLAGNDTPESAPSDCTHNHIHTHTFTVHINSNQHVSYTNVNTYTRNRPPSCRRRPSENPPTFINLRVGSTAAGEGGRTHQSVVKCRPIVYPSFRQFRRKRDFNIVDQPVVVVGQRRINRFGHPRHAGRYKSCDMSLLPVGVLRMFCASMSSRRPQRFQILLIFLNDKPLSNE